MKRKDQHGGYDPKGTRTRQQLITAGLRAFAKHGPEGVSTRELCRLAGTNISAITYYFGGKEGYYIEVVKYLVRECLTEMFTIVSDTADAFQKSDHSLKAVSAILSKFLKDLALQILTNPNEEHMASISSREYLHPTEAFDILHREAVLPMQSIVSELIGCAKGTPADSRDTIIMAHAVLGQIFYFGIAAPTIWRCLGSNTLTKEDAEHIAGIIAETSFRATDIMMVLV